MLKLSVFSINSGKLFHREGPTNEIAFCPVLVLPKGILVLQIYFLCLFRNVEQIQKFLSDDKDRRYWTNLNVIFLIHWSTLLLVGNQFINLKFSSDMWYILSNLRQNLMHLFCIICIFFFVFSVRVPGWTCVIKMWLNKRIAEHSSKFWT